MTSKCRAYCYLLLAIGAWGSLYVVGKQVMATVPMFSVMFIRYAVAGALLFGIAKKRGLPGIARQDLKYILLIGAVGYFLSAGSQLLSMKLTDASLASIINSTSPVVITLFAALLLKEKINLQKSIALLAAVAGAMIIVGAAVGSGQALGIAASVFAVVTWGLVSVVIRLLSKRYHPLVITAYGMLVAAVCCLPFAAMDFAALPGLSVFTPEIILQLLYIALVCTALAHVLWNNSLSLLEAGSCSMFYPVQPMVSALLGWLCLGEAITSQFLLGATFIVCGVLYGVLYGDGQRKLRLPALHWRVKKPAHL